MATLTEGSLFSLVQYYLTDVWTETGDPRLADYPLMGTLKTPLAIFLIYHFLVQYFLPRWMAHRKAYSLQWALIPYNLVLSCVNLYFFIHFLGATRYGQEMLEVSFRPTDDTRPPILEDLAISYFYFLTKYLDKCDTIFFLLRKKPSQVTPLHVYHHSMVPLLGWIYFRTNAFHIFARTFALLNTPIHTIMYAYYGLAAFGPQMQPYLWWKHHITQLQIIQFVFLFAHGVYFTLYQTGYSPLWPVAFLFEILLYLTLFTRFYLKSYKPKAIKELRSE